MSQTPFYDAPFVNSVFHPSDFSEASQNAFAHALAISLVRRTALTILHAGNSKDSWTNFPAVRATLERWGYLEPGSPRSAVFDELKLLVKKVQIAGHSPLSTTISYLKEHPTDLIVLATQGREGMLRWLRPSFAERVTEKTDTMTLFVPATAKGFVSLKDGSFSLKRILVPVDRRPNPLPAVEYAARVANITGDEATEIVLFHIGNSSTMPAIDLPEHPSFVWRKVYLQGEVVEQIVKAVKEYDADLVIMATAGHEGILDVLRGSVTEQVLRQSPCPLLAVPFEFSSR